MIRKFIPLDKTEIYDEMHQLQEDGSFIVDEAKDGQSTEKHLEGIKYIKSVLAEGKKIMPILVLDNEDGTYIRLDGFKRCIAYKELGYNVVEAFVCSQEEYRRALFAPFRNSQMRAWKGGQFKEDYGLHDGYVEDEKILFWRGKIDGLRIEAAENIQVHWGEYGRYRFSLGRRDFDLLAKAIMKL